MIESDPERCAQHRSVTVRIIQLTVSDPPERVGMGLTGLWAATIIAASQRPRRARCPDQPKCTRLLLRHGKRCRTRMAGLPKLQLHRPIT